MATRFATRCFQTAVVAAGLVSPVAAHAQSDCDALGSPFERFQCRLPGVLHLLYVIAAILTVILVIVAVVAVRTYRRNKHTQDDSL